MTISERIFKLMEEREITQMDFSNERKRIRLQIK